jgi:TatD DNase family protein
MELIDTHAHIYSNEFNDDRYEVLQRAFAQGVGKIVLPAIDSQTHEQMIELSGQYPEKLFPLMGLHPTSVNKNYKNELSVVEKYIAERSLFYGIGEIGVDLYWDKTYAKEQEDAFKTQVKWAIELNWPIVIHTRDSFNEVYKLLEPLVTDDLTGIFHCFSGTVEQARLVADMGFYMGLGGVLTFKNSNLRDVIEHVDINHLVLETDSPYLAPHPKRGKRNESSYLRLVANKLAEVKGLSLEQVAAVTTKNAQEVFHI